MFQTLVLLQLSPFWGKEGKKQEKNDMVSPKAELYSKASADLRIS